MDREALRGKGEAPGLQGRRTWPVAVVTIFLALLLGAVGARSLGYARAARNDLLDARGTLLRAQRSLLANDMREARRSFHSAMQLFRRAELRGNDPSLRLAGLIPYLGRPADAVRGVAAIGLTVAQAGERVSGALGRLDGGLSALVPRGGHIALEPLLSLSPAFNSAVSDVESARAAVERLPGSSPFGPPVDLKAQIRRELDRALGVLRPASLLLRTLPSLAGRGTTSHYFVAAQTPAELRGTGGFLGAYSILTVSNGGITLGPFQSIDEIPNLEVARAPAPTREFAQIYDRFGGAGFWRNINMTPDVPTAASLIEALYRRVEGLGLDGTIFVDPQALAYLMEATGPVRIGGLGRTLGPDQVVPFLTNSSYVAYPDPRVRKRALALTAQEIITRFLAGIPPQPALRSLARAGSGGHILLHAGDPQIQAVFRQLGVAGDLGTSAGDFLGVFASNAAGNKVDYYTSRHVTYEVSLREEGDGSARAAIRFVNDAPAGGEPDEALGPYQGTNLGPGDNLSFVSVYCGKDCGLVEATEDGQDRGMESHRERGHPMFARYLRVNAQSAGTLGLSFLLPHSWTADGSTGTYRLRVQTQPTVRPTTFTLAVSAPPGMRIIHTNVHMRILGQRAVWRGTVSRVLDFIVRFERDR
jgi:hypothetical protein